MSEQSDPSTVNLGKSRNISKHPAIVVGGVVVVIAMILSIIFAILFWQKVIDRREMSRERPLATQTGYALPSLQNLERMQVRMMASGRDAVVDFDVCEQDWPNIIAGLTPSEFDPNPCLWPVLANVTIDTKDKHSECLNTYALDDYAVGAFSTADRKYYRGGTTRDLKKSLITAYSNALKAGRVKNLPYPPSS